MKGYTDLEQSKKLAEFLPIESADMFLALNGTLPVMSKYIDNGLVTADDTAIPCWSLAALLDVLPKIYDDDNVYMPFVGRYCEDNHKFICEYEYLGDRLLECTFGETSVDACVKMIIKLHEQNLL